MSVLYSVFCILLMLFLEFSFWLLFVMLVYIFPLVLLLFFWTMWEFQSQMFFCLSLYTYCIHYINMEEMCPYSGSLCMLRSHANFTPFICLISMNSQCFGVPNFHNWKCTDFFLPISLIDGALWWPRVFAFVCDRCSENSQFHWLIATFNEMGW